jgi:hypothetical protein
MPSNINAKFASEKYHLMIATFRWMDYAAAFQMVPFQLHSTEQGYDY